MRKTFWFACAILMPFHAFAEDAKPADAPLTITLTLSQWQKVAMSISRSDVMTARDATELINAIQTQVTAQTQAKSGKK